MTDIPEHCSEIHRKRTFRVTEQQSTVIFDNPNLRETNQIAVDDCVLQSGERCDWLFIVKGNNLTIFVELKGSDIDKALQQLITTQTKLIAHVEKHCVWIVSYSGSPRFNTTIQNLMLTTRRQYHARLIVENSPFTYSY